MKVRIRHTPDNHWVVERRFMWFWWIEETKFYCWGVNSEVSTMACALAYAVRLVKPRIIEVPYAKQ